MDSPRNIYRNDVDFSMLALQSREFAKHLKSNGQLDFSDPEAVLQLTKSLLKRDFQLDIELPPDRLCPPVPNRFNYILWLQDLLDTTVGGHPEREVVGLDIGTGASCIYPLLGCAQRSNWKFIATDIDSDSIAFARNNVTRNHLEDRVRLMQTSFHDNLIPLDAFSLQRISFTMCNPPFYASKAELLSSAAAKSRPPFTACTGSETEMVTPGGEVAFVSRIVSESVALQSRVQWYTTMLGKLSSVSSIVSKLQQVGITNWAVTEFVQGSKTRRWAVAWSFEDWRPSSAVSRKIAGIPKTLLPFPADFTFVMEGASLTNVSNSLVALLTSLCPMFYEATPAAGTFVCFARGNTWSRGARRKHATVSTSSAAQKEEAFSKDEAAIGAKIQLRVTGQRPHDVDVNVRWLKGSDRVLFESFCGMVKRRLSETAKNASKEQSTK